MRVKILGTGTPAPSLARASSGYLIETGDDLILLDHGPGATHRLLEAGYRLVDTTHLFLSHLHYDHMMDYPRLLLQRWDQGAGEISELAVFGPAPLARMTEQLIGEDGVYALDLESRVSHRASQDVYVSRGGTLPRTKPRPAVREVRAGDVIEGSSWRMVVGQARHFQPYLDCLGYRFECDEGTLVYSGDSGGVLDSMIELARDCDVLIHMCHFASGTEPSEEFRLSSGGHLDVAEVAKRANAKTLVLTHFAPMFDEPGVLERMVVEMSRIYDGNIVVGRDLMEIPMQIGQPTRID